MTILSNWSNISPRLFDAMVFVEKEDTHMHIINWIMVFLDLGLVELGWRDE
jgi:hypothetical protein